MNRWTTWWREWRLFILFVVVMALSRSVIADWNQVPTGSMRPTILEGDRVLVDKLAYSVRVPFTLQHVSAWATPERFDIVTFDSPVADKLLIKRVIGLPGDVIEMRSNHLVINGEPLEYTPRMAPTGAAANATEAANNLFFNEILGGDSHVVTWRREGSRMDTFAAVRVPPGMLLVLGDNRDNSADSRVTGFIDLDWVTGRAHTIAFSYGDWFVPRLARLAVPLD